MRKAGNTSKYGEQTRAGIAHTHDERRSDATRDVNPRIVLHRHADHNSLRNCQRHPPPSVSGTLTLLSGLDTDHMFVLPRVIDGLRMKLPDVLSTEPSGSGAGQIGIGWNGLCGLRSIKATVFLGGFWTIRSRSGTGETKR